MESELSLSQSSIERPGVVSHERRDAIRKAEFQYLNRGNQSDKKIIGSNTRELNEISRQVVTEQLRERVVERYKELVMPEELNKDSGAQLTHGLLIEDLFPQKNIPLLNEMHKTALQKGDKDMLNASSAAISILGNALNILEGDQKDNKPKDLYKEFLEVKMKANDGYEVYSERYKKFEAGMRDANAYADFCLREHATKSEHGTKIDPDKPITLLNGETAKFGETAKRVLKENEEALEGIDLGAEFKKKFKGAKALVFSVDLNSVVNADEAFPEVELTGKANTLLNSTISRMKKEFPEKDVVVVVNTGRPADYAWGALEQLFPNKEARTLILAESGGVVMEMDGRHPAKKVAVDNPEVWGKQLSKLHEFLNSEAGTKIVNEPKDSMLSLKLAIDGKSLMTDTKGDEVNGDWMSDELVKYWEKAKKETEGDEEALGLINNMESKLKALYNSTAGFVDICDPDINKYSTLIKKLKKDYGEDVKTCIVHFGDSSTDRMPKDKTGRGEVNEGADEVFSYWVGNTKEKLIPEIMERGEYGRVFARNYILGYRDILKSVDNAVKDVAEEKTADNRT